LYQEGDLCPFPSVGDYVVHQPFFVFSVAKVVECAYFPLGKYFVVVLYERTKAANMERRMYPSCLQFTG
jgi:hypothetical protein